MGVGHSDGDGDRGIRGSGVPRPSGNLISIDAVQVPEFSGVLANAHTVFKSIEMTVSKTQMVNLNFFI